MMKDIIVCVKAVPDPQDADKIKINPKTKTLSRSDIPMVINPLDRNAMEAALYFKEKYDSKISVLSMGPPETVEVIKECLALGADDGYLLSDMVFAGGDTLATARTLSRGIGKIGIPDLVLCGMASSDGSTEWVGPQIAAMLDIPVITSICEFVDFNNDIWRVKAKLEDGYRLVDVVVPALFTVTREVNQPRELSFSGIMKARKKEVITWTLKDLDVSENAVGLKGSPTVVNKLETMETGRQVEFLNGSRDEKASLLVEKLKSAGVLE
jgi:electron transfer flavoprotein beta subunit